MFPVVLNLKDQLCLVVGSGPVGRRKATCLLAAGAQVRLISRESPVLLDGPMQPEWLRADYHAEHLRGVRLVFAAATPAVNQHVREDAHARGLWVNIADDPEGSDFHLPAVVRRGSLVIGVSTGGASPGLARVIRERLEQDFDEAFGHWVNFLGELRPMILARAPQAEAIAILARLTDWHWLERLRAEDPHTIRQAMLSEVESLLRRT